MSWVTINNVIEFTHSEVDLRAVETTAAVARTFGATGRHRDDARGDVIDRRIAFHEAGHAVVAVVAVTQGLALRHARIDESREVLTDWRRGRAVWPCVYERARFLLAGFAAERHFAPNDTSIENSRDDFVTARALVNPQRLTLLRVQVDLIMATKWRQVETVAHALLERQYLTGDDILDLIRAAQRIRGLCARHRMVGEISGYVAAPGGTLPGRALIYDRMEYSRG